jgi:hypothetical protein
MRFFRQYILIALIGIAAVGGHAATAQPTTVVTGTVVDASNGEPVPFANVSFIDTPVPLGTSTDEKGRFRLETNHPSEVIRISFIGYRAIDKKITKGITQTVHIRLEPSVITLEKVVVREKRGRYNKKNNPAVTMMEKAIAMKSKNRIENFDYYQYLKHEKMMLALANISDSMERNRGLKRVDFLFDNADTSKLTGKRYLPFYFGETLSRHYFRKHPKAARTYVDAKRNVEMSKFLDTESMDAMVYQIFGEVNVYDNEIFMLNNKFMSPLSPLALNFYRFYITDTVEVSGTQCYELYFTPANPLDFGFKGNLYLTADSTYAVKRAELRLTPNTQVNFVTDVLVEQEFVPRHNAWILDTDVTTVEFSLIGRTYLSFHGQRVNVYKNMEFNIPQPDSIHNGLSKIVRLKEYDQRDERYWHRNRLSPLTVKEDGIYQSYKRLDSIGVYKFARDFTLAMVGGYVEVGPVDLGPVENLISFNSIENVRLRVGGKTNGRFHRHLFFEGFLAYGTRDEAFKFNTTAMYSFNRKKDHPWEFPMNLLTVSYEYNTKIPGQGHLYGSGDRLFLSIGRGTTEKMTFDRKLEVNYDREISNSHFRYTLNFTHLEQEPLGELLFSTVSGKEYNPYITTSFGINLRLAPNERYVQSQRNRYPLNPESPVYSLKYMIGIGDFWNSEHTFHKLQANFMKRWYFSSYGYLDVSMGGGIIFNPVPYPSLFVIQANQDLAFQEEAFNMMRFFEFVADKYVDLKLSYCFNGFLLNRIPLIKKLKWREVLTFKAIYGGVGQKNQPDATNDLMLFPHDADGNLTTFALGTQPFMEASVGIENIFSFLRVDLVKRINYLDHPKAREWAVRVQFRFSF